MPPASLAPPNIQTLTGSPDAEVAPAGFQTSTNKLVELVNVASMIYGRFS